uniref:Uncharacterized protein n=1 Tax=Marseillevirus LCMAC201 TaxID=2506605 RepID=A0A481YWP6_9VIRU|nr:MAG: hypothetical protein LCMAC201_04400 [Marseillevirus LCMAC201]
MNVIDIDITQTLRDVLPIDSFLFNPSIAHVTGDIYIVSVRSYISDISKPFDKNPNLSDNPQHPWFSNWVGEHDGTYILPMIITEHAIQPITTSGWPLYLPMQDMRLFRFMKDGNKIVFILSYNVSYNGYQDMLIKAGDSCDDWCYLIGWSYLMVDINSLDFSYVPGEKPLCTNISNPLEKNWSIWRYDHNMLVYLVVSYVLTPIHMAFSFILNGIKDGDMTGGSTCRMITPRPGKNNNVLGELEQYYDNKLFISLSSPSYVTKVCTYQAVGHLKIEIDYLKSIVKKRSQLAKFVKKFMKNDDKKYYHHKYIYFMFIYHFKVQQADQQEVETGYGSIELTGSSTRVSASITHVTPAFMINVDEYDYFLNFPAGMVLNEKNTIVSYGNGDSSAHLLIIPNETLKDMLIPVSTLTAAKFEFIHAVKNEDDMIIFNM